MTLWLLVLLAMIPPPSGHTGQTPPRDAAAALVLRVEQAATAGDRAAIVAMGVGRDRSGLEELAATLTTPLPARVVIKERDRSQLADGSERLLLEIFTERGIEARVAAWRIDVREVPAAGSAAASIGIAAVERLTTVSGLYRLSLDASKQFDVRDLTMTGTDLTLQMAAGSAFVADTPDGPTAVVLIGRGHMRFAPPDQAERTQLRIFAGDEVLTTEFDAAFIRIRPAEFEDRFAAASLVPRASEDDTVDYDVLSYDIETSFAPDRLWVDGRARLKVRVTAHTLSTMSLRLSEPLAVRDVFSPEYGRLLHLRVVGQNTVIVNLPTAAVRKSEIWLNVIYGGRLEPQTLDREAIALAQDFQEPAVIPLEPRFVYSNRSYWYPQSTVTDYADATLRITVPAEYDVIASGAAIGQPAPPPGAVEPGQRPRKVYVFESNRPVRYLACVISRFNAIDSAQLNVPASSPPGREPGVGEEVGPAVAGAETADETVSLFVQANPRQAGRARGIAEKSAAIFRYYAMLVGEAPYPSFTLAVTDSDLPGGHSPAYFAVLNQALPSTPYVWRNDPVSFDNYPSFFLAHELAHQWWGQGVGWKNYHEQWLSEGFAQYFAALYAAQERGDGALVNVMRQMRRWAIEASDQGPVYLGYRLGHIKGDSRVFRAVVYNKSAMVLHMLRRVMGDEAFFSGIRRFYAEWRFKKAGTDDVRVAMEAASGRDLSPFFDAWIHGVAIPRVKFSYGINDPSQALVRFEHRGDVMETPVTVTVTYRSGETQNVLVLVGERVSEAAAIDFLPSTLCRAAKLRRHG
ncbi:MAG: hypothetical protein LC753_00080 [Acidobacteria bacterium]|nr:hypothetical protein [Acidobacteriota bacterium]